MRCLSVPGAAEALSRKDYDELAEFAKEWGGKGLAYLIFEADGSVRSPILKFLSEAEVAAIREASGAQPGSVAFIAADAQPVVERVLGALRPQLARRFELIPAGQWRFLFVVDFPLFKQSEDGSGWTAEHHPFTAPKREHEELLESDPGAVVSEAYDMVLNGLEMASGSIRINRAELQTRVLDVIGIAARRGRGALRLPAARAALRRSSARRHRPRHRSHRDAARRHGQPARGRRLSEAGRWRGSAHGRAGAAAARAARGARARGCAQAKLVGSRRAHLRRPCGHDARLRRGLGGHAALPPRALRQRLRAALGRARGTSRARQRACRGGRGARRRRTPTSSSPAAPPSPTTSRSSAGRRAAPGRIVTTPLEHPAVSGAVHALEQQGCEVVTLPVDADGRVPVEAIEDAVQPGDLVCCLIWASNLTGVIQPVAEAAAICAERGVPLHLDAVQACPALEVDIGALPGEVTAAVSAHKLGGPKGAGLLCGRGLGDAPARASSAADRSVRCGPARRASRRRRASRPRWHPPARDRGRYGRYRAVRDAYEAALAASLPGVTFVGERAERTPGHSLALIEGLHGHALVALLDGLGRRRGGRARPARAPTPARAPR